MKKMMKMAGLLGFVGITALCCAANALGSEATSPAGTIYTGEFHLESQGHLTLHDTSGLGITIECNGTGQGKINQHGPAVTVLGGLTALSVTNCTGNWLVTTLKQGTLEGHVISGTNDATITSSGTEVTAKQSSTGLHCIYATSATDLGTGTSGSPGKFDVSAVINRTGGSSGILCGPKATLTGSLTVTKPNPIFIS